MLKDLANGEFFLLTESSLVGRKPYCQIFVRDPKVSSEHAMIRRRSDGSFWLTDLRSLNGTWVNRKRVTNAVRVRAGDQIQFGNARFDLHTDVSTTETGTYGGHSRTEEEYASGETIFLVSDVFEFSQKCEALPSVVLAEIMGAWYCEARKTIEKCGGLVDKFLGDAFLAFWPDATSESRSLALRAAMEVANLGLKISSDFSEILDSHGLRFDNGVALHRGEFAHGPVGSRDFTLLGLGVTVAFRMEALTRVFGCRVIVSGQFLKDHSAETFKTAPLGPQKLKGIEQMVELFGLDIEGC
ncbi:MAG: FHA domain-containing protein [Verrucomicrobiales bacterium]